MASTLSDIEEIVRFESRDDILDITTAGSSGIAVANLIYRRLGALIKWPELYREYTSLTTVSEQEAYTWPSSVQYVDVTSIEVQDPTQNNNYVVVPATRSELDWSISRREDPDFPLVYRRVYNGTNHVLQLAPKPKVSGSIIRITGLVEPAQLTSGSSTTLFLTKLADHALAYMIAADYSDQRNFPQRAQNLIGKAAEMLSTLAGKEVTPSELKTGVLDAGLN
jgi:hypothetical protein